MGIFAKIFSKKRNTVPSQLRPNVFNSSNENEKMNWSMKKAALTFHYFEECLKKPKENQEHFSIKARLENHGKIEHIWLLQPTIDAEGKIFGTVGNIPMYIKNIKLHQKIRIEKEHISDWMLIENQRLIGGYTIRAIREGLKTNQLKEFDRSLGTIQIDAGEDYFQTNLNTPEGAILSLEEAYIKEDLTAVLKCKNFTKEAEFLLYKSMNTILDGSLIQRTAEALKSSFILNLNQNGFPNFKGIKRAFKRFKISEYHFIITEVCYYPNGGILSQKIHCLKENEEWKVLGMED